MKVEDISISKILFKENIRQMNQFKDLSSLMQSIKDNGLLQPVGVKASEDKTYLLLWGHKRLEACKKLGWTTIPAVIFLGQEDEMTEEDFFILNATENLQRTPNTLLELGRICKILKKTLSISEIASRLAIPKSRVESALNEIARIPLKWQRRIKIMTGNVERKGDIPLTIATRISGLRGLTPEQQNELYKLTSRTDLDGRKIILVRSLMKKGLSIKDAVKKADDYKNLSCKFFVRKQIYEEAIKDAKVSQQKLLVDALNKVYPNMALENLDKWGTLN